MGTMDRTPSALENAWSNYVLVRPGMTYDELKATTTGALAGRTPGTLRTVVLTSLLALLAAVPYIVQNPLFIGYVLELAALSRAGVTPAEMFERTGRYTLRGSLLCAPCHWPLSCVLSSSTSAVSTTMCMP